VSFPCPLMLGLPLPTLLSASPFPPSPAPGLEATTADSAPSPSDPGPPCAPSSLCLYFRSLFLPGVVTQRIPEGASVHARLR